MMASLSFCADFSALRASRSGVVVGCGADWAAATFQGVNVCITILLIVHRDLLRASREGGSAFSRTFRYSRKDM